MSSHATPKIRVALVGTGIGGLTLARALLGLSKLSGSDKIELSIYEAASSYKVLGAGVGMGGNVAGAMEFMNLASEYEQISFAPPEGEWRKGEESMQKSARAISQYIHSSVHRASLLDILIKDFPANSTHFSKRLESYTDDNDGPIILRFRDGTTATCDLLVGSDGIRSAVRGQMFKDQPEFIKPVYTGTQAFRGMLDMEVANDIFGPEIASKPQMIMGKNQHIVMYPMQERYNFVIYKSNFDQTVWTGGALVAPISNAEVARGFESWNSECLELMRRIENPTRWALHQAPDLPTYSKGRVCLIGDAAHACVPYHGAGAGLAIEDAIILAALILHESTTIVNIAQLTTTFTHLRLPRASSTKAASVDMGLRVQLVKGEDVEGMARIMDKGHETTWGWRVEDEVKKAQKVWQRQARVSVSSAHTQSDAQIFARL